MIFVIYKTDLCPKEVGEMLWLLVHLRKPNAFNLMGQVNLSLIIKTMFLQHSLTSMNLHFKVRYQGSA